MMEAKTMAQKKVAANAATLQVFIVSPTIARQHTLETRHTG